MTGGVPTRDAADRRTRLALWLVLAAMLALALASIARWTRNLPLAEDWTTVAPLTGHEPSVARWVWAQNNEHRLPLPKLVYLGLLELTGDFRSGMVGNALLLAAAAAGLMLVAWRIRGRAHWSDAFFPVVLLHLGNWENLAWGWQLQFTLSTALTLLGLGAVAWAPPPVSRARATVLAAVLLLLPISGANGLVFAVALATWAAYVAWWQRRDATPTERADARRDGGGRGVAGLLAVGAVGGLLLVALYFVGYERPPWVPANPGRWVTLVTGLHLLGYAFGPIAAYHWTPAVIGALAVLVPTAVVLAAAAVRTRGAEQVRALGLLCFGGAAGGLIAAMAWGRAGYVESIGLPTRYVLFSATALCGAYLTWLLYAPPRLRAVVPGALCVALVALLPLNTQRGFEWRDWYVTGMKRVEADLAAGVPRREMARRNREFLLHWNEELLTNAMGWLREARQGPWGALGD